MFQLAEYSATNIEASPNKNKEIVHFSYLLEQFGLNFFEHEEYLHVGEIAVPSSWIIDISVSLFQLESLCREVIPYFKHQRIPFEIVANSAKADSILNGHSGLLRLGKLISIFPADDNQALSIANFIIARTKQFSGPEILTDCRLSNVVYARYGSFSPQLVETPDGNRQVLLNNSEADLAKAFLNIPFILPPGLRWPFGNFADPKAKKDANFLKNKYRRIKLLKEDAKGNVIKAIFFSKLKVKTCVIKEGKKHMNLDNQGRDMRDRIHWQFKLHKELKNTIPIPVAYEIFDEWENSYLVLEYKAGKILDDVILQLSGNRVWLQVPAQNRQKILQFALQILDIVEQMHLMGYIHRDITPANFLVVDNSISVIDLELAYSRMIGQPNPPFELGTLGFLSPEQRAVQTPDINQDIYAIGGLLIALITGVFPSSFSLQSPAILFKQLSFFIPSPTVVKTICKCFSITPSLRPSISHIRDSICEFKSIQQAETTSSGRDFTFLPTAKKQINEIIISSLKALTTDTILNINGVWASKVPQNSKFSYCQDRSRAINEGYWDGLCGITFILSRAFQMGYPIKHCLPAFTKSISSVRNSFILTTPSPSASLFEGTSGYIISLVEGFQSGLLADKPSVISDLQSLLKNTVVSGYGIANGWAGLGLAQAQVPSALIDENDINSIVDYTVKHLLNSQQKDGSWMAITDKNQHMVKPTGFAHGTSGIICFLLCSLRRNQDEKVYTAIKKALTWLMSQGSKKNNRLFRRSYSKSNSTDLSMQNGSTGIALTFLKAYEVLKNESYRDWTQEILNSLPASPISRDLSLSDGIVGLGELYLEASLILNSSKCENQAAWIAELLCHRYVSQEDQSIFWSSENTPYTSAGLATGMSGIIHFLIRYNNPGKLTHPLLLF
jgi:serine/threonine protein kinase